MNGKYDRIFVWTINIAIAIAWMIEIALIGSAIYAALTNASVWPIVTMVLIFTIFVADLTNKSKS